MKKIRIKNIFLEESDDGRKVKLVLEAENGSRYIPLAPTHDIDDRTAPLDIMEEEEKAETIAADALCRWCGDKYSDHEDTRAEGAPVPRMPCTGLKSGFMAE